MSKPVSAVAVEQPMKPEEQARFHLQMCGRPLGAWHKPRLSVTSALQAKFGVGKTINVGSNDKKRAYRRAGEFRVSCCNRKRKNCVCGN